VQPKVQKFSPVGVNLEHNNETNTKQDKTEIKSEERQKLSPAGLNLVRPKVKKFEWGSGNPELTNPQTAVCENPHLFLLFFA
jgi:hypothetical protein